MNAKALSLLTGIALLGSAGMASAAEPVTLDEKQMDSVTAGAITVIPAATVAVAGGLAAGSAGNIIVVRSPGRTGSVTVIPAAQVAFVGGVAVGSAGNIVQTTP